MAHRQLNAHERQRITKALTGIDSGIRSEDHVQDLIGFVEGDRTLCHALVKQTPIIRSIHSMMASGTLIRSSEERVLRLHCMLLEGTLSHRAAEPFLLPDKLPAFIPSLRHLETLPIVARIFNAIFAGPDSDTLRDTCWSLGVPLIVIAELLRRYAESSDDCHNEAAMSIVYLANILADLCAAIHRRQDELSGTVPQLLPVLHFQLLRAISGSETGAAAAEALALCLSVIMTKNAANAAILAQSDDGLLLRMLLHQGKLFVQSGMGFQGAALILAFTASAAVDPSTEIGKFFQNSEKECFSEAEFEGIGRLASSFPRLLTTIRREHFRPDVVAHSLKAIQSFIDNAPPSQLLAYRYFISNCYGALHLLHVTLSNVDIVVAVRSCRILIFALEGNPAAVRYFLLTGAVSLLRQLLDDYSDEVLASTLQLLSIISTDESAMREIDANGIVSRVLQLLDEFSQKIPRADQINAPFLGTFAAALQFLQGVPPQFHKLPAIKIVANLISLCACCDVASVQALVVLLTDTLAAVCRSTDTAAQEVATVARQLYVTHVQHLLSGLGAEFTAAVVVSVMRLAVGILSGANDEIQRVFVESEQFVTLTVQLLSASFPSSHVVHAHCWWVIEKASGGNSDLAQRLLLPFQCLAAARVTSLWPHLQQIVDGSPGGIAQVADELYRCLRCLDNIILRRSAVQQPLFGQSADASRLLHTLLSITPAMLSSGEVPLAIRDAAVHLSMKLCELFPAFAEVLTPHYARAVLLCESSEGEEDTMLANKSYKALMGIGEVSVPQLVQIGLDALAIGVEYMKSPSGDANTTHPWRWAPLDAVADMDDVHDTLVLVIPLLNGMLHQDIRCCARCLESQASDLFIKILDPFFEFEVALRISALDAFSNMITSSETNIATVASCAENSLMNTHILQFLEKLLVDACAYDEETLFEVKASVYVSLQKFVMLVRNFEAHVGQREQILQQLCMDAPDIPAACDLLLLFLQDNGRAELLHSVRFPEAFSLEMRAQHSSLLHWALTRLVASGKRNIKLQSQQYLASLNQQ